MKIPMKREKEGEKGKPTQPADSAGQTRSSYMTWPEIKPRCPKGDSSSMPAITTSASPSALHPTLNPVEC